MQEIEQENGSQDSEYLSSYSAESLAERRYLWTARAFALVSVVSFLCNIVLIITIFQIVPLVRIEPFLVTFSNKERQIVNIRHAVDLTGNRTVSEAFVRQYILISNTFVDDMEEMKARWLDNGPMQEMSAPAVYQSFLENAKKVLAIISSQKLTRDVKILSSNELSKGIWQVEYETTDITPTTEVPTITNWTAQLRIIFRRKRVPFEERLKNPLGFTVVEFSFRRNDGTSMGGSIK
ncbi:MAG: VirB8/TrbF family protein [Alphaproteobacteria bacterium]